jgi:hypothetical protein
MATAIPSNWNSLSGGTSTLGNPADLGPYRGLVQERGGVYDQRSQDQWDWARDQFKKNAGITDQVQKQALDTGAMFTDWSKKDRALYDESYVPAMKEQLDYARSYTTPERMAANRGAAMAGSNITFDAAADMAKRALMSYGVDPSSGRYAGLDAGLAAKRAASAAGQGTKSDRDTEMMGQQLLANAIRTGQVLPGQAANEAGVSLAAGNQAVNTGLATTASGAQTMGTGLQWAGMGDDMMKEWKDSLLRQTQLGMQQNRDVAEQQLAREKLAQGSSSGIGAALGVAGPLLKMGGSMAMNYFMPGSGSMMGGGAGPLAGAGSGSTFRKGGPVRKLRRFRAGGMVRDVEDQNEDENVHRGYRPKVRDEPARQWREPMDTSDWDPERPESDTDEDRGQDEQNWVPNYDRRYAAGGAIPEDNTDEMPPFDPEGADYDYRTARLAGIHRGPDGHMASRDPVTGMQLKGRRHPTFDQAIEEDRRQGYGLEKREGRYYTKPFKRFDMGGFTGPDVPPMDIGTGQDFDPYDPAGELWGQFDKDNPEREDDQGEGIGRGVGGQVGSLVGQIWGPIGAMAGREIGQKLGAGVGAAVQGKWGDAAESLVEGTPLDFAFAEGGEVPDDEDMFVDTPDEGMGEEPSNMVPPEASPSGGEETDDVHALLNEGEFVIPKDVTSWFGEKFFQNIIQKAYKEKSAAQAQGEPVSPQQQQAIQMSPPSFESMGA